MVKDNKRQSFADKIHAEWEEKGSKGTVEGLAKLRSNVLALKTISKLFRDSAILVLFQNSEQIEQFGKSTLIYDKSFKTNIKDYYGIEYKTYSEASRLKDNAYELVIVFEIHNTLNPIVSKFFINNSYDSLLGISYIIDYDTVCNVNGRTKRHMLNMYCPVFYSYKQGKPQKQKIINSKPTISVINVELGTNNIQIKTKNKSFNVSEKHNYDFWKNRLDRLLYLDLDKDETIDSREVKIKNTQKKVSNILYNNQARINGVKKLIEYLHDRHEKTVILGNSEKALLQISNYTICRDDGKNNALFLERSFHNDHINEIASREIITMIKGLEKTNRLVLTSYYKGAKNAVERISALSNIKTIDIDIIIFKIKNSFEGNLTDKWLNKSRKYKIIEYENVETYIKEHN